MSDLMQLVTYLPLVAAAVMYFELVRLKKRIAEAELAVLNLWIQVQGEGGAFTVISAADILNPKRGEETENEE